MSCSIHDAFDLLEQRFDTHHVHTQARAYLNSITLADIRHKHSCDEAEALQLAHDQIFKTLLKCGKSLQRDDHRIFALQRVVQGEAWAATVLPLTGSANLTYADFHTSPNTAVSTHLERIQRKDDLTPTNLQNNTPAAMTFYGSQYGLRNTLRPTRRRIKASQSRRLGDLPTPNAPSRPR